MAHSRVPSVAIAGAGPGGLATALAIRRACPRINVRIFERAKELKPCGGCIGISSPNVKAALAAAGADKAVFDASLPRHAVRIYDKDGTFNKAIDMRGNSGCAIGWFELQQVLLNLLPGGLADVSLGSAVSEVEETTEGVRITTATGETFDCDVLIGADGNRSAVRSYVSGEKPEYVGAAVWRFFMEGENPMGVEPGALRVWTGECKVLTMAPVLRGGKLVSYCSGLAPWPEDKLGQLNTARYIQAAGEDSASLTAKLERFHTAFASFEPRAVDWIMKNAVPESVLEHPMYALQPRAPWTRNRVALVGDAAHVMPPNLAQGTASALEDAMQIAASLKEHGVTAAALAHYEQVRKERLCRIWDESTDGAVQYYREGDETRSPFLMPSTGILDFIQSYEPPDLSPL